MNSQPFALDFRSSFKTCDAIVRDKILKRCFQKKKGLTPEALFPPFLQRCCLPLTRQRPQPPLEASSLRSGNRTEPRASRRAHSPTESTKDRCRVHPRLA